MGDKFSADASSEVSGSVVQLCVDRAHAHAFQLHSTARTEGSVPPAPAGTVEEEFNEIQVTVEGTFCADAASEAFRPRVKRVVSDKRFLM